MDAAFAALADPTRRRMLKTLRAGERPAGEIERSLGGDLADFASGWRWRLDALEGALEGEAREFDRPRWAALKRAYAATL